MFLWKANLAYFRLRVSYLFTIVCVKYCYLYIKNLSGTFGGRGNASKAIISRKFNK